MHESELKFLILTYFKKEKWKKNKQTHISAALNVHRKVCV